MVHKLCLPTFIVMALLVIAGSLSAGQISGTLTSGAMKNQVLTPEGSIDWAVWGYANGGTSTSLAPDNRKLGGMAISDLTSISNGNSLRGLGQFGAFAHTFDWTDGDPDLTVNGALTGLQHNGQFGTSPVEGEGFSFTVPADTQVRILKVYVTTHVGVSTLTASLSDGSAAPYVALQGDGSSSNDPGAFTIFYAAGSPGQTLDVEFVLTTGNEPSGASNAALFAVSLNEPLSTSIDTISAGVGGSASLSLKAGPSNGSRNYILLGSVTGTAPGTPLPGGQVTLPLNWDIFTNLIIDLLNSPVFSNFTGKLDGTGAANAVFDTLGPIPGAAGITMHFAYALNNPWSFASNAVAIDIVP